MSDRTRSRFKNFVDLSVEDQTILPLIHTTSAYDFVEIAFGDEIIPTDCEVFEDELTYLFYGRPAYRTQKAVGRQLKYHWPFCFVIDPDYLTDIKAIYPFDTGAFALDLYKGFFHGRTKLSDFRLPGDLSYARKIVGKFYIDSKDYLKGGTDRRDELPLTEFEAHGIQALAQFPQSAGLNANSIDRDERSTSIEIQTDAPINIIDATLALIVPEPWLIDPHYAQAIQRWGFQEKTHHYEVEVAQERENWVGSLYHKVREIYRELGLTG